MSSPSGKEHFIRIEKVSDQIRSAGYWLLLLQFLYYLQIIIPAIAYGMNELRFCHHVECQ